MRNRRAGLLAATVLAGGLAATLGPPLGAGAASVHHEAPAVSGNALVRVPDVVDRTGNSAASIITDAGLVPRLSGSGTWVMRQHPRAGSMVPAGTTVDLLLRSGPRP